MSIFHFLEKIKLFSGFYTVFNLILIPFLPQYGGNARTLDHEGKSCLSYARLAASRPPASETGAPLSVEAQSGGPGALVDLLLAAGCHDNVLKSVDKMSSSIIWTGRHLDLAF